MAGGDGQGGDRCSCCRSDGADRRHEPLLQPDEQLLYQDCDRCGHRLGVHDPVEPDHHRPANSGWEGQGAVSVHHTGCRGSVGSEPVDRHDRQRQHPEALERLCLGGCDRQGGIRCGGLGHHDQCQPHGQLLYQDGDGLGDFGLHHCAQDQHGKLDGIHRDPVEHVDQRLLHQDRDRCADLGRLDQPDLGHQQ